ncbi:DUF3291 domain-containing protein [Siansivirga zeaxanthinifaciens]|uniref:DUF3291 domain-containing protein n=1 Tax=Siansivirga zeaxanthinifaciens CC-SAMT-1 TaxID=1454006 RepID=A0A0C5VYH8_9FLAO|nr:DUF3291 domain-containing protein [Siansivirga zeaxanthinifaciens]AJR04121.1 hypothetical protein AW14_11180 [Siansivirga zeaxanthinifaciens CC-SAMT-1]
MNKFHLAQVNIAKMLGSFNDPVMKPFFDNVERMNAIADSSPGFVWRLKDEDKEEATHLFKEDNLIINLSVWESPKDLFNYTYHSGHIEVFKRKKEWFSKLKMLHMAFWYIPEHTKPSIKEAHNRLMYINAYGETPYAFNFKNIFSAEDALDYKPITQ